MMVTMTMMTMMMTMTMMTMMMTLTMMMMVTMMTMVRTPVCTSGTSIAAIAPSIRPYLPPEYLSDPQIFGVNICDKYNGNTKTQIFGVNM